LLILNIVLATGIPADTLTLAFDSRQKCRQRNRLDSGEEVGLQLARGTILRGGTLLGGEQGRVVAVVSAEESVSTVHTPSVQNLARVAYHLGNRHQPLQIGDGWVRYRRDHVIDEMVKGLGLEIVSEWQPFEPEPGAYDGGHHHGD